MISSGQKNINYKDLNVLLLAGKARQAMPIMKDLHDLGCKFTTVSYSKLDVGYSSVFPSEKILCLDPNEDYEFRKKHVKELI